MLARIVDKSIRQPAQAIASLRLASQKGEVLNRVSGVYQKNIEGLAETLYILLVYRTGFRTYICANSRSNRFLARRKLNALRA